MCSSGVYYSVLHDFFLKYTIDEYVFLAAKSESEISFLLYV